MDAEDEPAPHNCDSSPTSPTVDLEAHDVTSLTSTMTTHRPRRSLPLLLFFILCSFLAVTLLVLVYPVAKCQVRSICDRTDRSASQQSPYLSKTLSLLVPTEYVWACLATSALGIAFFSLHLFLLFKRMVKKSPMVQVAAELKRATTQFSTKQSKSVLVFIIPIFVLLGLFISWPLALSYIIGVFLTLTLAFATTSISNGGSLRIAAADDKNDALNVAFRSTATVALAFFSLGLAAAAGTYLMFADIQALFGLVLGVSTASILHRIAAAILVNAVRFGAQATARIESHLPLDDPRHLSGDLDCTGHSLATLFGVGVDLLESFLASVFATALLGASLPFAHRNPFALCVFNHLYIDDLCGPLGYPERRSYANYICSADQLYSEYPNPAALQSNALFVALPFAIAMIAIFAAVIICSLPKSKKEILRGVKLNLVLATILILLGAAGFCWGLFGARSTFQQLQGFGSENNLKFYQLSDSKDVCSSLTHPSGNDSLPLPRGKFILGKFRPLSPLAFRYGPANQTPWRLFLCIFIGLSLGFAIHTTTKFNYSPLRNQTLPVGNAGRDHKAREGLTPFRKASSILAWNLASAVVTLTLTAAAVLGSHALYGTYGIGILSVSLLSTAPIVIATGLYGSVTSDAEAIAQAARQPPTMHEPLKERGTSGDANESSAKAFTNCAALVTAFLLLFVVIERSGLAPTPYQLVGTPITSPTRLLSTPQHVTLLNMHVLATTFLGVITPYVFGVFTLLALYRVSEVVRRKIQQQLQANCPREDGSAAFDRMHLVKLSTQWALIEAVNPLIICISAPLIIGFGLGQKALVGMLTTLIASAYLLNLVISSAYLLRQRHPQPPDLFKRLPEALTDVLGPSLNILAKLSTFISLLLVSRMKPDSSQGWIAVIILLSVLALLAIATLCSMRKQKQEPLSKSTPPSCPLSPCCMVRPRNYTQRQVEDASYTTGSAHMPVDSTTVPDLELGLTADEIEEIDLTRAVSRRQQIPLFVKLFVKGFISFLASA